MNNTSVVIVLPVHNEEATLAGVVEEIDAAFSSMALPMLLFVDDGSSDRSREIIAQLIGSRGKVCCLAFSRNFGHQAAVMAGLAYAPDGCIVLVMDADGQDPPSVALELVHQVLYGFDIAYGIRQKREGKNRFKRLAYWSFYRVLCWLSSTNLPLDAGDFCAYSSRAARLLANMGESYPYIRGLRAWIGLNQVGVPYYRPDRVAGETSYNLTRLIRLALDGILGFSLKPLRFSLYLGLITFLLCLLLGLIYLMLYVFNI
ncbi:MAG: glycosyltransferase family 2 protein [Myxacorys chilensis ATA2-1-KO14]|nr:glycosyltransferase family 2 protein [Myxacorys chilensis ATA2-1-KO14]